MSFPAIIVHE